MTDLSTLDLRTADLDRALDALRTSDVEILSDTPDLSDERSTLALVTEALGAIFVRLVALLLTLSTVACGSPSSLTLSGLSEALTPDEQAVLAPHLDGDTLDLSASDLVHRSVGYRVHAWVANLESVSVRVSAIEGKVHEVRIDTERMSCAVRSERDARTGQDPLAPEIDGVSFRTKGFIDCRIEGMRSVTHTYEVNLDASELYYSESHTEGAR